MVFRVRYPFRKKPGIRPWWPVVCIIPMHMFRLYTATLPFHFRGAKLVIYYERDGVLTRIIPNLFLAIAAAQPLGF